MLKNKRLKKASADGYDILEKLDAAKERLPRGSTVSTITVDLPEAPNVTFYIRASAYVGRAPIYELDFVLKGVPGKKKTPFATFKHETFSKLAQVIKRMDELADNVNAHFKRKQKDKAEQKELQQNVNVHVGHIYYSSWGYDETHISFYKVLEVKNASAVLQEVGGKTVRSEMGSDYTIADPSALKGQKFLSRMGRADSKGNVTFKHNNHYLYLWNGSPLRETAFGYGR
jgi:hypothetical protein